MNPESLLAAQRFNKMVLDAQNRAHLRAQVQAVEFPEDPDRLSAGWMVLMNGLAVCWPYLKETADDVSLQLRVMRANTEAAALASQSLLLAIDYTSEDNEWSLRFLPQAHLSAFEYFHELCDAPPDEDEVFTDDLSTASCWLTELFTALQNS